MTAATESTGRPVDRRRWREILDADPDSVVSQSPEWADAACADGRLVDETRRLTSGGQDFILPLVRRRRPRPLTTAGSMPAAWGYGGLVGPGADEAAVRLAVEEIAATGWLQTAVRPLPAADHLWRAATDAEVPGARVVRIPRRAHVIDISAGRDAAFSAMSSSRRRNVRKAEKAGLDVVTADDGSLADDYYRLFEQSVERWAGKQREPLALARFRARRRDPLAKLRRIMTLPEGRCRVSVAYLGGEPVAGVVVLVDGNAHYTRGAMDKERVGKTNANDLLMWLAIEHATERGCRSFHMGESGDSSSLAEYKERFGARPHDYGEYRIERLPLTAADRAVRGAVKRVVGFRDT